MHQLRNRLVMIDLRHQQWDACKEQSEMHFKSCGLQRLVKKSWMGDFQPDAF
jgi:hypothetical protein